MLWPASGRCSGGGVAINLLITVGRRRSHHGGPPRGGCLRRFLFNLAERLEDYVSGGARHGVETLICLYHEVAVVGRRGDRWLSLVILKSIRLGGFNAVTAEGARLRRLLRKG
jgi:hypothetical protein